MLQNLALNAREKCLKDIKKTSFKHFLNLLSSGFSLYALSILMKLKRTELCSMERVSIVDKIMYKLFD